MDIPAKVQILSTIQKGSVFLFADDSFPERKHFFITLNSCPKEERVLFLTVVTTAGLHNFCLAEKYDPSTIIHLGRGDYSFLSRPSIINCNTVHQRDISVLVGKLESNSLKLIGKVKDELVDEIIRGVKKSRLVEEVIKKQL